MATETMAIIEAGGCWSPRGRDVRIAPGVEAAVAGTRLHLPDETVAPPQPAGDRALMTEVTTRQLTGSGSPCTCRRRSSASRTGHQPL